MKLYNTVALSLLSVLINLSYVYNGYAQAINDDSNKAYADNLTKSCAYAKEHVKYIDDKTKQYFNKSSSKKELIESLNVLTQKWEEIRINNECFTVGTQIIDCKDGKNKAKELVIANSIIRVIRTLSKDIENNKDANVINKNLRKSQNDMQSMLKTNCPS